MKRTLFATALLTCVLSATYALAQTGAITLPNAWRIAPPAGPVGIVGTLPTGVVLSRDGARAFVLDTGHGKPEFRVLDSATLATTSTIVLPQASGAPLRDAHDDGVWIANTETFGDQISHIDTARGTVDRTFSLPIPFYATALAVSPDGRTIAVAGDRANEVDLVDLGDGIVRARVAVGRHPAALAYARDARTLFVADRAERFVDAIDVARHAVVERIATGLHPDALAVSGHLLYVANADDDDVVTVDTATRKVLAVTRLPFAGPGAVGASPNALTVAGDRLYVSCGAANAIGVYRITDEKLAALGAIPTGWYPTAVAVDATHGVLFVADGKGEGSHANPDFRPSKPGDYIADNLVGSIRRLPIPSDAQLGVGARTVFELAQHVVTPDSPVVRRGGPIKHIIYIIKENRTYDQVLGDLSGGDGNPSLVMFGENITPNEHAIEQRFGIFDRFFDNAHVSADGHNWSMAAFANDYLEKMWPPQYANRRPDYDFEDGADASTPHGGYLFDDAKQAGVTLRNYGEFVTAGPVKGLPVSTQFANLRPYTDRRFPTFDLTIPDSDRYIEWKREFDRYEATNSLPALEIVRFMRDHTAGTKKGENTPEAMVADNDQAVGHLVDAVSHSHDWASTAIFVLEDDAQNGPDHVDEQRSTFYLASPYAAGGLQHEHYTTASVLRTIEIILGMKPMSAYDAGARPLTAAFTTTPNLTPYDAIAPKTDLTARNGATAYRASDSAAFDFTREDAVPEGALNDILWHAVKGVDTPEPPYGLFTKAP